MNRFRRLGYISYRGRIRVNKSLLNVVLLDQLPEENATRPTLFEGVDAKNPPANQTKILKG
jgi:CRP/FNR family cyclic AMP-dependent transcriptional regulator